MPDLSSALSSWLVLGHSYYILSKRVDLLITLTLHNYSSRQKPRSISPSPVSSRQRYEEAKHAPGRHVRFNMFNT